VAVASGILVGDDTAARVRAFADALALRLDACSS
jgi:hypothetical protein